MPASPKGSEASAHIVSRTPNSPQKQANFMKYMQELRPVRYRTASLTISNDRQSGELRLSGRCDYWDGQTWPLTDSEREELRRNPPCPRASLNTEPWIPCFAITSRHARKVNALAAKPTTKFAPGVFSR
jgi:hypothetical protein